MSATETLAVTPTGNGALRLQNGDEAACQYAGTDLPNKSDADFLLICTYRDTATTGNRWITSLDDAAGGNTHRIGISANETGANEVEFRITIAGTTKAVFLTPLEYQDSIRFAAWTETTGAGTKTLHIAGLEADGTIQRDSNTTLTGSYTYDQVRSQASSAWTLGGLNTTSSFSQSHLHTLMMTWATDGNMSSLDFDDDDVIRRLLLMPHTIGEHDNLDLPFCVLGDIVDADNNWIDNRQWTNITTSMYARCPNTGIKSGAFVIDDGAPQLMSPYEFPCNFGTINVAPENSTGHQDLGDGRSLIGVTGAGSGGSVESLAGFQIIDQATGRPLCQPVTFDYHNRNTSDAISLVGINPYTDTHNDTGVWHASGDDDILLRARRHHGEDSGFREVVNIATVGDDDAEFQIATPDFGVTFNADQTDSYCCGDRSGDYVVELVRTNSGGTGRMTCLLHNRSTGTTLRQDVTAKASAGSAPSPRGGLPRGVHFLDADRFLVLWDPDKLFAAGVGHDGLAGVIGSVSGFTSGASWYNANTGAVLDGTVDDTLGSINAQDDAFKIIRDNAGVTEASRDYILPINTIYRDGVLLTAVCIDGGNFDRGSSLVFDGFELRSFTVSGNTVTANQTLDIEPLLGDVIAASELETFFVNRRAQLAWARSSGKQAIMLFTDQNGATMSTGVNAVHSTDHWGTQLRALTIPDAATLAGVDLYGSVLLDTTADGGKAFQPFPMPHGQGLPSSGVALVQVLADKTLGRAQDGAVQVRGVDLSGVVAALPGQRGRRRVRSARNRAAGVRGIR